LGGRPESGNARGGFPAAPEPMTAQPWLERPAVWGDRAVATGLLVVAALDLLTAATAEGAPYWHAAAPEALLGAGARAATAAALARSLVRRGYDPLRPFAATLVFALLALWTPRPVWLYTTRHPAFDPYAPMLANLLHIVWLSLAALGFLRAAGTTAHAATGKPPRTRAGLAFRLGLLLPLAGYPLQVGPMLGRWGEPERLALTAVGAAWLAGLALCLGLAAAEIARAARAPDPDRARVGRRVAAGTAAALGMDLLVRALAGDLARWAAAFVADLDAPYGPFSLFAVRVATADPPGTVAFSCALLAFALVVGGRPRRPVTP
jgi:hypothetical protein